MVAHSLLRSGAEPSQFARELARRLRWWVLALPPGVGLATLRGALRLWLGWSPQRSGVDSAGNGPAMRAALLGLWARDDEHLVELVRASSRLTHTDPRAESGARLVARWARAADAPHSELVEIAQRVEDEDFRSRVLAAMEAARGSMDLDALRPRLGYERGVTGFVVHTLPAVGLCWLRYRDRPRDAIEAAVRLGGDTDTVAAIVGALFGAHKGASRLPAEWIHGIADWPVGVPYLRALAEAMATGEPQEVRLPPWWGQVARNLVLMTVVVVHVLARMLGR